MPELHPAARELLSSDAVVHLATVNRDGSPQVSMIWVGLDGGEIVSGHMRRTQKVRNVERDPRVVLSLQTGHVNEYGLLEHLVIQARARVQEGGARELLQRLAHVYLGPDVAFPPPQHTDPGYVLRFTPDKVGGIGPWA